MSIRELLCRKRAEILKIAARHGARKVRVLGRSHEGPPVGTAMSISSSTWRKVEASWTVPH